ncbi:ribbon-helix-helix domain-containing protein [Patescibacteria group bacterium]|nr:ribbon-helix-helix domain-containing protein [Patescibacteria group bacterium]MBU2633379.1 ribbon-helix-helix domain-containing protein [Patescibacteria group bacterium]
MSRTTETLTISLPPKIAQTVRKTARQENKTKSELFRVALNLYLEEKKKWQINKAIAEGVYDIKNGRVFGPFKNIRDFKKGLEKD